MIEDEKNMDNFIEDTVVTELTFLQWCYVKKEYVVAHQQQSFKLI